MVPPALWVPPFQGTRGTQGKGRNPLPCGNKGREAAFILCLALFPGGGPTASEKGSTHTLGRIPRLQLAGSTSPPSVGSYGTVFAPRTVSGWGLEASAVCMTVRSPLKAPSHRVHRDLGKQFTCCHQPLMTFPACSPPARSWPSCR